MYKTKLPSLQNKMKKKKSQKVIINWLLYNSVHLFQDLHHMKTCLRAYMAYLLNQPVLLQSMQCHQFQKELKTVHHMLFKTLLLGKIAK